MQTTSNLDPSNAGSIPGRTKTEVSFDGGRNWLELADPRLSRGPGLPGFLDPLHAWWIDRASSPSTDAPAAIWRTTDGGRSRHRLAGTGLPGTGYLGQPVFIDQLHAALAWTSSAGRPSGLFATNDGGDTWRAVDTPTAPLPGTRALSLILIKHGQRLLALLIAVPDSTLTVSGPLTSPDGGSLIDYTAFVWLSDAGGQTWSQPRVGPNIVQPAYFWAIPSQDNRGRLFLLDVRRLWISEDDGATWFARALQAPAGLRPSALVSVATGTFFALAVQTGLVGMVTPGSPVALIRSSDDGAHWSAVTLPRP